MIFRLNFFYAIIIELLVKAYRRYIALKIKREGEKTIDTERRALRKILKERKEL